MPRAQGPSSEPPGPEGSAGRSVILFVDDDPLILRSMRRLFGDAHEIHTASSGDEALALLAKGLRPAVALVDHKMPGMTGVDLLQCLSKDAPDTVRIMLTGQADLPLAMEAVNRGHVFRFLTKPVDLPSLEAVVAESVEAHRQREEENRLITQATAAAKAKPEGPDFETSALQKLLEARLTSRELDVLRLIGQGRSSKEIGPRLGISPRTVDVHRSHILDKLGLHNSTSLVRVAVKAGMI